MAASVHPYLSDTKFAAFAHRGGGGEHPENSEKAFAAAVSIGFRYIETDVQATSDGVVMIFHDDDLAPLTDGEGVISSLPLSEVQGAKILGSEPIMTLEQALETFPETRFNIDIKTDHALEPTIELLTRMEALDRVCFASFNSARLARVRQRLGLDACLSAGSTDVAALKFASWGLPFRRTFCHCVQVPMGARGVAIPTRHFIRFCNARGVAVHVWTIDEADDMRRLIRRGVDGLITDYPSRLKQVAIEEGVW